MGTYPFCNIAFGGENIFYDGSLSTHAMVCSVFIEIGLLTTTRAETQALISASTIPLYWSFDNTFTYFAILSHYSVFSDG